MNDLAEIKKRIFNEDKIEDLFEAIGCQHIKLEQGGSLITAQLPDKYNSSNTRAVQCRINEGLWCSIRNRSDFSGDIFNLVAYIIYDVGGDDIQTKLNDAKSYICNLFHWDYSSGKFKEKVDHLKGIRSFMDRKHGGKGKPNKILDESVLDAFVQLPNNLWEKEGISLETQREYKIGFDVLSKRITIPVRNRFGQLVGVKGRMFFDEDVTEHEPKYMYLYKCNQSNELFNFYIAVSAIRKQKEVIIVEGEKSCMKFYENGIYNVVALGSSDISPVQKDMLFAIGRDVEIVLAYDSDKTFADIQKTADKLNGRTISMIYDKDGKTGKKSAPIDKGIDVWNDLYNNYKYDLE